MNDDRSRDQGFRNAILRASTGLGALGLVVPIVAGAVPTAVTAQQSGAVATSLVFEGVTVVDVEHGKLLPAQRVVIVGNRIQAVGGANKVELPKAAQVVDARGKYLIPGLWDLHVHTTADLPYLLLIANGVTGFRDGWSYVPLDTMIQWRREILAGARIGPPRQILSGSMIQTYCPNMMNGCAALDPALDSVQLATHARRLVDSLKSAGIDMIKMRDLYPATTYLVIASEARRLGIPFGGHAWDSIDVAASDSGASIIDHMRRVYEVPGSMRARCWAPELSASVAQCQPVAERFKHNNTWIVPTILIESTVNQAEWVTPRTQSLVNRLPGRAAEFWDGSLLHGNWLRDSASSKTLQPSADSSGVLRIAERVGLPILAGTDSDVGPEGIWKMPPGFSLQVELATYEAEGLTPLSALRSATLNPAKLLHATDSLGTVAPGKLADLVLLDADPLADITNTTTIRAVVANGRYFDRTALDQLLAEVQAKAKQGFRYWWDDGERAGMTIGRTP